MIQLKYKIIFLFLAVFLIPSSSLFAIEFEKEDFIHISNLHRLDDDLYALGNNITNDGVINGDFNAAGAKIINNGTVKYSANVGGEKFKNTGKIMGSLRFFGQRCAIDGYIGRSVLAFCSEFHLEKNGVIEKDIEIGAGQINIDGTVKGNANISGGIVVITGTINNDLTIHAEKINIVAPALINGNLTYYSDNQAMIDISSGVTIVGETTWNLPEDKDDDEGPFSPSSIIITFSKFLAAFLFGVIFIAFCKKYLNESITQLQSRFSLSAAIGFLGTVVYLVVALALMISLILIAVGYILASGSNPTGGLIILSLSIMMLPISGLLTVVGSVLFYSGKIILGLWLGYLIVKKFKTSAVPVGKWQLLIGLLVLTLLFNIPYIGFLLYIVVSIIGGGAFIQAIRQYRSSNQTSIETIKTESGGLGQ